MDADVNNQKTQCRRAAQAGRQALDDKPLRSDRIMRRVVDLPEFNAAQNVLFYVGVRNEVRTADYLSVALAAGKRVVVPYCEAGQLLLVELEDPTGLAPGAFGIPEPTAPLRHESRLRVAPEVLDLVLVPGVAFDRHGGRVGHGQGYYDKLLARTSETASLVGLAFSCQIVPKVPVAAHDVRMHKIVTEGEVICVEQ